MSDQSRRLEEKIDAISRRLEANTAQAGKLTAAFLDLAASFVEATNELRRAIASIEAERARMRADAEGKTN